MATRTDESTSVGADSRSADAIAGDPLVDVPTDRAVSVVITESLLRELASGAVGDGIEVAPSEHEVNVPFMGPVAVSVGMTIVGVDLKMHSAHPDRLLTTVTVDGRVAILGAMAMADPITIRLSGTMLVEPVIEVTPGQGARAVLDVPNAELVGIAAAPDGATDDDPMGQMLSGALGDGFFGDLAQGMGTVGVELGADVADTMGAAGFGADAEVVVGDGTMTIRMAARPGFGGCPPEDEVADGTMGVGVAPGFINAAFVAALEAQVGFRLPFDVVVDTRDEVVLTQLRSTRLVEHPLVPDLRRAAGGVRTRLADDHIELSVAEAWIRLPSFPGACVLNRVNRTVGSMVGQLALSVRVRRVEIPAGDGLPGEADAPAMYVGALDVRREAWLTLVPAD